MSCELTDTMTKLLAIGVLLSVIVFAWLMRRIKRAIRNGHPALWKELDDAALPLHRRLANSARLFVFVLLGRPGDLEDPHLRRITSIARILLLLFLVGGLLIGFCQ